MQTLKDAYAACRSRGFNAVSALALARQAIAAGKWASPMPSAAIGSAWESCGTQLRFCEAPERAGLRLVGTAYEVCRRIGSDAVDHDGWFRDEDGCLETVSGLVFQVRGVDGCPRYVAGINDEACDGAASICFDRVFTGEPGGTNGYLGNDWQALRDCAAYADQIAESYAESEREYNAAWQAGRLHFDTGEELAVIRTKARTAARELKAGVTLAPTLCELLREKLAETLESMNELRARRATLAAGDGIGRESHFSFWTGDERLRGAFNEGAQRKVLA